MGSTANEVSTYGQPSQTSYGSDVGTDEIRSDIEATRSGMSETVDAIQAKLSPQNVQEQAEQITERAKQAALDVVEQATERMKDTVTQLKNEVKGEIHDATIGRVERMVGNMKDTTRDASSTIVETVKANPIPAALVGIGLAWLFMNKSGSSSSDRDTYAQGYSQGNGYGQGYNQGNGYGQSYAPGQYSQGYGQYSQSGARFQGQNGGPSAVEAVQQKAGHMADSVSEAAGHVADSVSEAAGHVKEKAGEFANQAQAQVENLSGKVQDQAQRVFHRSQSMIEENPLMTSALALALGAAIGLLLPETNREDEFMGTARDKFVGQVSEVAQDTLGKAQRVATEVIHNAGDTVKEEAKAQGLTGKPSAS